MIQDIAPSKLDNSYKNVEISENDLLFLFDEEGKIFVGSEAGRLVFLRAGDCAEVNAVYLFSIDERRFFLAEGGSGQQKEGFSYRTIHELFSEYGGKEIYAAFTAYHLWRWYADNRYCGRCRGELEHSGRERALVCPCCGNVVYPRINPAVIVGITNRDRILLTKYRNGYSHNALVAGFTEIGETVEETVQREVMEETGLKVRNIRYYKSQPWGMAQDVLMGFYCEVDGDPSIHMDRNELKYAEWVKREDIVLQPNNLSLTNEMMEMFKLGVTGTEK